MSITALIADSNTIAAVKSNVELQKVCPSTKDFLEGAKFKKLENHLYDFMYEFGKGSGNIPAC